MNNSRPLPRRLVLGTAGVLLLVVTALVVFTSTGQRPKELGLSPVVARGLRFAVVAENNKVRYFTGSTFAEWDSGSGQTTALSRQFRLPQITNVVWGEDHVLVEATNYTAGDELYEKLFSQNTRRKSRWWLINLNKGSIEPVGSFEPVRLVTGVAFLDSTDTFYYSERVSVEGPAITQVFRKEPGASNAASTGDNFDGQAAIFSTIEEDALLRETDGSLWRLTANDKIYLGTKSSSLPIHRGNNLYFEQSIELAKEIKEIDTRQSDGDDTHIHEQATAFVRLSLIDKSVDKIPKATGSRLIPLANSVALITNQSPNISIDILIEPEGQDLKSFFIEQPEENNEAVDSILLLSGDLSDQPLKLGLFAGNGNARIAGVGAPEAKAAPRLDPKRTYYKVGYYYTYNPTANQMRVVLYNGNNLSTQQRRVMQNLTDDGIDPLQLHIDWTIIRSERATVRIR